MVTIAFQFASLAVLVGMALAVFLELVRTGRQLVRDRKADRWRIQQLIAEIESIPAPTAHDSRPAAASLSEGSSARPTGASSASSWEVMPSPPDASQAAGADVRQAVVGPRPPGEPQAGRSASDNGDAWPTTGPRHRTIVTPPGWHGTRAFRVARKTMECDGCTSLYLTPLDGKPLPLYIPGQFLTFTLHIPGQDKPTVRCYSLSDVPNTEYYRCTIKKIGSRPDHPSARTGLASSYLYKQVRVGDVLAVGAPHGSFVLDVFSDLPVVLVAGGIGITPLLSMLNTLVRTGFKNRIYLFFGVRQRNEHPFRKHLAELAGQHAQLSIITAYSRPSPMDQRGVDYQIHGYIEVQLIKQTVPTTQAKFYVCGPSAFMQSIIRGLIEGGVSEQNIQFEAFGPSGLAWRTMAGGKTAGVVADGSQAKPLTVEFSRTRQTILWDGSAENLLEFAEQHGVDIPSGCRSGNCGTCATLVKSGSVNYHNYADPTCEAGYCLPCVCTPAESLVLDL